jgi:hypothetical protein
MNGKFELRGREVKEGKLVFRVVYEGEGPFDKKEVVHTYPNENEGFANEVSYEVIESIRLYVLNRGLEAIDSSRDFETVEDLEAIALTKIMKPFMKSVVHSPMHNDNKEDSGV